MIPIIDCKREEKRKWKIVHRQYLIKFSVYTACNWFYQYNLYTRKAHAPSPNSRFSISSLTNIYFNCMRLVNKMMLVYHTHIVELCVHISQLFTENFQHFQSNCVAGGFGIRYVFPLLKIKYITKSQRHSQDAHHQEESVKQCLRK